MKKVDLPHPVQTLPPWDTVFELAGLSNRDSWLLVGGLMTQAHAMLAGYESRATDDIDMLIDVMASNSNIGTVVKAVESLGFEKKEPGLPGSPFHRLTRDKSIVDVLIAEHLPTRKRSAAKVERWPMMEIPGGSQAIERRMLLVLSNAQTSREICIPDLLGALILKSAAYMTDNRDNSRHLEDVALLASLITDHASELQRLHGSDIRRLKRVAIALEDINQPAWLKLPEGSRLTGQDTLRILSA
ncbi:MAG: hypothetical protein LBO07_06795 [Coriobacteriales bacterium]|jgi:hypothetical protein|nr:hypothetical protein [Coriobacteriales bacterium]